MNKIYYLDTSIWLDLFEDRNEPNLPKGDWAQKLLNKIVKNDDKIAYSDIIEMELIALSYNIYEIKELFDKIRAVIVFIESTEKQARKAKDLAEKRNIPKNDALHALIARENKLILITLDKHFNKLLDITKPIKPYDIN